MGMTPTKEPRQKSTYLKREVVQTNRASSVTVTNRLVNGKIRKCYRATAKGRNEAKEVIERLSFLLRKVFR